MVSECSPERLRARQPACLVIASWTPVQVERVTPRQGSGTWLPRQCISLRELSGVYIRALAARYVYTTL